jgi:8-oxoguanine deaminase
MRTLIRDATAIVDLDRERGWFPGGYLVIEDGLIERVEEGAPPQERFDRVIDARDCVVLPGLVNTHHHFIQTLNRCYPPALNFGLRQWLKALYPVWAKFEPEHVRLGTTVALAELLLSGCTTTCDHHCFVPRGGSGHFEIQVEAARELGMRFHVSRGSTTIGESKGGLALDANCEEEDDVLADCEALLARHHDPARGAMTRVALSPVSLFGVSRDMMRQSAEMARRHNVRLHTHLAETLDEQMFCVETFGMRPVDLLEDCDWMSSDVWLAHGIHFNDGEVKRLGEAGVGVAHCPSSNMRLGSGVARIGDLRAAGSPIGVGVDGSASNDSSHMLAEVRQALLLQRVIHGADEMTVQEALRLATTEGARCLGRDDVGALKPGMCADVAIFSLEDIGYSGAGDPLAAMLLCAPGRVRTLLVNGRVVVEDGQLVTCDLSKVLPEHRKRAKELQGVAF